MKKAFLKLLNWIDDVVLRHRWDAFCGFAYDLEFSGEAWTTADWDEVAEWGSDWDDAAEWGDEDEDDDCEGCTCDDETSDYCDCESCTCDEDEDDEV